MHLFKCVCSSVLAPVAYIAANLSVLGQLRDCRRALAQHKVGHNMSEAYNERIILDFDLNSVQDVVINLDSIFRL